MGNEQKDKIDCFQCVHFAVTWESKFPRLCKLYGFKTARLPSIAVLESSGEPCVGFERKTLKK